MTVLFENPKGLLMLRSFISLAARGEVTLRREIILQLGIGPNGILYGGLYPAERSIILSPIPPQYWSKAYKIIIHTDHAAGSLSAAADAIASLGLDVISSWASTESALGHLCSTSIVVTEDENNADLCDQLEEELCKHLDEKVSSLSLFHSSLRAVRVTPLSILKAYESEMKRNAISKVQVTQHTLCLDGQFPGRATNKQSLWFAALQANRIRSAKACILTPDTEEGLLRICPIAENARLTRIVVRIQVQSNKGSFAGYWKEALRLLKEHSYSVFVAHNLLISKDPHQEEAEFYFVADRADSSDVALTYRDIETQWKSRFEMHLKKVATEKEAAIEVRRVKVTRPRGVGVPCFFASNARPGDNEGARAAIRLCKTLEGLGFMPVNIDIAEGGRDLRTQVKELVKACHFMVVLHCPGSGSEEASTSKFSPSDWVLFEESAMSMLNGKILSVRFSNVRRPAFGQGTIEMEIPASGLTDDKVEEFSDRLERWQVNMYEEEPISSEESDIPEGYLRRDLVHYYEGGTADKQP